MPVMDIQAIREILPHRYPMLLVDRIEELEAERIVGIKNVTINEPFFNGHFPDFPVMPGVLIVEAMAQVAGVLVLNQMPDRANKIVLLAAVEQASVRTDVHIRSNDAVGSDLGRVVDFRAGVDDRGRVNRHRD